MVVGGIARIGRFPFCEHASPGSNSPQTFVYFRSVRSNTLYIYIYTQMLHLLIYLHTYYLSYMYLYIYIRVYVVVSYQYIAHSLLARRGEIALVYWGPAFPFQPAGVSVPQHISAYQGLAPPFRPAGAIQHSGNRVRPRAHWRSAFVMALVHF